MFEIRYGLQNYLSEPLTSNGGIFLQVCHVWAVHLVMRFSFYCVYICVLRDDIKHKTLDTVILA